MRWNDLIGMRVGQYTIFEELGRGGAARVFRAQDEANDRPVAFKVLPIETDDHDAFMQRFDREADAISKLHHPNIVQVYSSGKNDEFVYLVLRLLEGGTLRQRIAVQRLPTQDICQYMIQIALALHYAHQLGIIHRDVKPSNMLLDTEQPGHILLSDFGTAKILNARGLTRTGATVGTPEYMSPEQAEGREVGPSSDIYSLGCALYEALAGRPPFVGATSVSVLYQQVHAQPTYIRSYNAQAPRELWDVIHKCLAKQPGDRYSSAKSVAEALQPFAEGVIQPTPAPWHSPVTGRLTAEGLLDPVSRPLRNPDSAPLTPMPPPYTPTPAAPGMPGMNGASGRLPGGAGPIPLYLEGGAETPGRAPTSQPIIGPRGARPTLRLPSTATGSGRLRTYGALSPEGQALSAFEAQLEAEEPQAPAPQPPQQHAQHPTQRPAQRPTQRPVRGARPGGAPFADVYPTIPTPSAPLRGPNSGPMRGPNSGPMRGPNSGPVRAPQWRGEESASYRGPNSGPLGAPQGTRAPVSGPRRASTTVPVDLGRLRADIDPTTLGRSVADGDAIRRRCWWARCWWCCWRLASHWASAG